MKRPKSFTYCSEELGRERSILSSTFTAPPKIIQADFEAWTSSIKMQTYTSQNNPALLLRKFVASAGSWLWVEKLSADRFQFTCVRFAENTNLCLGRMGMRVSSV